MCGISGMVIPSGSSRSIDARRMEQMRDALHHRGPDGAGLFLAPRAALGHRRLSIVDLAGGHQPMHSADGRFVVVFNGEIFNHPTLKTELEAAGITYASRSDTETALHLFARDGAGYEEHLRGMFALAVWDTQRHELTVSRDRFGVKPLYYVHADDGTLWFASEIKALLAGGAITPRLNFGALPDFLANHAPSGDETLYEGVRRLPPGHRLRWREGELSIEAYWDLPQADSVHLGSDDELIEEYGARLREAVRVRLMADVPLGTFLSGGIDSAAITALTAELVGSGVKTFSVAFAEREANEFAWARLIAARYRTDHHEVVLSPDDFFAAVPRLIWHEDEPMAHPSSVALHCVSELAARHVKVVLTGEGSDETLAGYNRYRATRMLLSAGGVWERAVPGALRNLIARQVRARADRTGVGRRLSRTFLARPATLDALYFENFAVFDRARQARLLSPERRAALAAINPYAVAEAAVGRRTGDLVDRLLYADTKTYLHELLMKQDQMSMAASIESRVPFLDHPLVEFATRLPAHLKLKGTTTKVVLRRAMADLLPAEILHRPKMGFPVPVGAWLRGAYAPLLQEFVVGPRAVGRAIFDANELRRIVAEHAAGQGGHAERLWALLNFEIWQRIAFDGESPEQVMHSARLPRKAA